MEPFVKKLILGLSVLILIPNLTGCVGALIAGAAATGAASGYYLTKNYQITPRQGNTTNNQTSYRSSNNAQNNAYNTPASNNDYAGY